MDFETLYAELRQMLAPQVSSAQPPSQGRLPNYGYGPVTPESRAGIMPEGAIRQYDPSPGQEAGYQVNRLLAPYVGETVGGRLAGGVEGALDDVLPAASVPAQMATDVAMDPEAVASIAAPGSYLLYEAGKRILSPTPAGAKEPKTKGMTPAEAQRETDPLWTSIKGDPGLESMYSQLEQLTADSKAAVPGVNAQGSNEARERAGKEAKELRRQLLEEVKRRSPKTFRNEYPWLAENAPLLQGTAGAVVGGVLRGAQNVVGRLDMRPWYTAVNRANEALDPSALNRLLGATPNADRARRATDVAQQFLNRHNSRGRLERVAESADDFVPIAPIVGGATVGAEAALLPHQYNNRNAPEGSRERNEAEKALGEDFWSTVREGAGPGALGAFTGAHFSNALIPKRRLPVEETNALLAGRDGAARGQPNAQPPRRETMPDGSTRYRDPATGNWVTPPRRRR